MLIFDRCRRSSAAVTPVKYECDANNLTGPFARSKILLTEKLTNGALVTPTPEVYALLGLCVEKKDHKRQICVVEKLHNIIMQRTWTQHLGPFY